MAKYRKRPVVVEAVQITEPMTVETLEGTMHGESGDWLITGIKGERYVCKDDIFRQTYEPANEDATATAAINVRPEVAWFAERMEVNLRRNDYKGGWKGESVLWLLGKLMEEVGELADHIVNRHGTKKQVIGEAADIGAVAMMIADEIKEWWPDA